jgi:hypothetical protein
MSVLSKQIPDPSLADLLNAVKRQVLLQLNCHAIGRVESFDASKQTVKATIAYKRKFSKKLDNGKYQTELQDYPILIDCPVVVVGGGSGSLTFPISQGDECVLLFNDRSIDDWFSSGQVGEVQSLRLHSMADGIALVGVRSIPNVLEEYDTEKTVLQHGDTKIKLGEKISVENSSQNLNSLLQDLITEIKAITVTSASPGSPSGVPLNASALTAIATQIEELLE